MSKQPSDSRWPVMVLAHNEERHIEACPESIFGADAERVTQGFESCPNPR